MKSIAYSLALLAVCLLGTGCATIFTGTYDEMSIRSEPEGARIFIDGLEEGRTPATLDVKRPGIGDKEVTLRLDGYEPKTFVLRKEFNAVSVINLACVICWAVDVATGAVTQYRPRGYDIDLIPEGEAYRLETLPQDEHGRYVVRVQEAQVLATDTYPGVNLIFIP